MRTRCASLCIAAFLVAGCSPQPQSEDIRHSPPPNDGSTNFMPRQHGVASYYGSGDGFDGKITANGEVFSPAALTAAHRTLPFGSKVKVRNLENGREVTVRINDRGPVDHERIIDLSAAAAKRLGMMESGLARVRVEQLAKEVSERRRSSG